MEASRGSLGIVLDGWRVGSGLLSLSHNTQEAGVAGPSHTMSYDGTG